MLYSIGYVRFLLYLSSFNLSFHSLLPQFCDCPFDSHFFVVRYHTVLYCTVQQRKSASCDNDVEYPYRTGQNEHRTKISFASSSYPVICRNLSSSVSRSRLTYLIQIPCVVPRSTLVSSLMRRERERGVCEFDNGPLNEDIKPRSTFLLFRSPCLSTTPRQPTYTYCRTPF
jgi:hypothetical protein